jgi:hypothetical protein
MLGRKVVLTAALAGAAAFSGGVAPAATDGVAHVTKPPSLSNVHYPCRHHDGSAASTANL